MLHLHKEDRVVFEEAHRLIDEFRKEFEIEKVTDLVVTHQGKKIGLFDLVAEGGGAKGVLMLGSLYCLDALGLRPRKIYAASISSMATAMYISNKEDIFDDGGATGLIKVFKRRHLADSLDHPLLKRIVKAKWKGTRYSYTFLMAIHSFYRLIIRKQLGLFKMTALKRTLMAISRKKDHSHYTVGDLCNYLKKRPELEMECHYPTADLTNKRVTLFPNDLKRYVKDPDQVLLVDILLTSGAIPLFFAGHPLSNFTKIKDNRLEEEEIHFTDGGLAQPISLAYFDTAKIPRCPTFGMLLSEREGKHQVTNVLSMICGIIQTGHNYLLTRFDETRVIQLSTQMGENRITTLGMTSKNIYFIHAVKMTLDFLRNFDFEQYKQTREKEPRSPLHSLHYPQSHPIP